MAGKPYLNQSVNCHGCMSASNCEATAFEAAPIGVAMPPRLALYAMPSTSITSRRLACFESDTCRAMVIATGISTAAVAVFSTHIEKNAAMNIKPNSNCGIPPPEMTTVIKATRRVRPCLRSASARNKLASTRKTVGLEKGARACVIVATPRITAATGTIKAAIGSEIGSSASILPVKMNSAMA